MAHTIPAPAPATIPVPAHPTFPAALDPHRDAVLWAEKLIRDAAPSSLDAARFLAGLVASEAQ